MPYEILTTIVGPRAGLDVHGNIVLNRPDGTQAYVDGSGSSHLGSVADEAAMVALSTAVAGSTCTRTDTGTVWVLTVDGYDTAGNWQDTGASGATVTFANITGSPGDNTALDAALAAKADFYAVKSETGNFTLTAANHSNRRTDANKGTAIAVTWDTGHGMTNGDCGRIVQTGAGAVTISAGTGTLTLSPGVAAAVTTADGSWLDWEYVGSDELLITGAGRAKGIASAFTSRALTAADDGQVLICGSAQTATINTGLQSGFGCSFKGAIAFDGTATTTDVRTSGATNPWCAVIMTGTNTYDVVGSKA